MRCCLYSELSEEFEVIVRIHRASVLSLFVSHWSQSVSRHSDGRLYPLLHQYVVCLSKALYLHCFEELV